MESRRLEEQENIQTVNKPEFIFEINDEMPIMHTTTKEDIKNLESNVVKRIMDHLKPIIERFIKVSDSKSSCTIFEDSDTTNKIYSKDDEDLAYENELLKIKLEEKEKENKLLRNEVLDMNKLLEAKVQTSSYDFKTPTKEDLFASNNHLLTTSFPVPENNEIPNGNITINSDNILNNNSILSVQEISFVPQITKNLVTPTVKEYLPQHSSNKNTFRVEEKTTFKSSTLVAAKVYKDDPKETNTVQEIYSKFKSTRLVTSKKDKADTVIVEITGENKSIENNNNDVEFIEKNNKEQIKGQQKSDVSKEIRKEGDKQQSEVKNKHHWPKGTCVVAGDSMLEGIDERKMSSKRLIKVRKFPGATIDDMQHYLVPILEKKPDHIILHVGTNDAINHEGREIVDKLLKLKLFISEKLPNTNVIISKPILRVDAKKPEAVVSDVNIILNELSIDMIENKNLEKSHLNGKGLHLNRKGILLFAKNLIDGIRKL